MNNMIATQTTRPIEQATVAEPNDNAVLVEDIDALTAADQPGCGDDNPYQ
ncbi:hypothetical protein [Streptomyces sp. NPDC047070]